MRVLQMTPVLQYGDAVGNDMLALNKLLISEGYETRMYAECFSQNVGEGFNVLSADDLPKLDKDDVLIYHLSVGSVLNELLPKLKCRKIAIYHNVTPKEFFVDYGSLFYNICNKGINEVKQLNNVFDYCLADSEYNRNDLLNFGYNCPIDVRPILIPFKDYEKTPNQAITQKYDDGKTNILFVGRVVPNKKHEDIIAAFSCYKKYYNPEARLFLIGSAENMDVYKERLDNYISKLGVEDVYFTGKIPFDEILAYYKVADMFLCMSEHEGFCVPLVEAMYFDVPVIAYSSSAIPYTLAGCGVLLQEKNPLVTAGVISRVMTDDKQKEEILINQRKRVSDLSYENTSKTFLAYIKNFISGIKR